MLPQPPPGPNQPSKSQQLLPQPQQLQVQAGVQPVTLPAAPGLVTAALPAALPQQPLPQALPLLTLQQQLQSMQNMPNTANLSKDQLQAFAFAQMSAFRLQLQQQPQLMQLQQLQQPALQTAPSTFPPPAGAKSSQVSAPKQQAGGGKQPAAAQAAAQRAASEQAAAKRAAAAAASAAKKRRIDARFLEKGALFPESSILTDLQATERRIDLLISQRRAELQEMYSSFARGGQTNTHTGSSSFYIRIIVLTQAMFAL
jgi:hypothetical protein